MCSNGGTHDKRRQEETGKGLAHNKVPSIHDTDLEFYPKPWGNHKFILKRVTQIPVLESRLQDQCEKQAVAGRWVQKLPHVLGMDVGYTLSAHQ